MAEPDLTPWGGGAVITPLSGGARSRLFIVETLRGRAVARAGAESDASLRWLIRAQALARRAGIVVPPLWPTVTGALSARGWTLETFLDGRPGTPADLAALRPAVARFHRRARALPDRPGHAPMHRRNLPLPAHLATTCRAWFPHTGLTAIHGDLHPGNLIVTANGAALIDWEEARRDATAFDGAHIPGTPAHPAYELAVGWQAEPVRARALSRRLHRNAARV